MNILNWKQCCIDFTKIRSATCYKCIWATDWERWVSFSKNAYCMQVLHGWYLGLSRSDVDVLYCVYIFSTIQIIYKLDINFYSKPNSKCNFMEYWIFFQCIKIKVNVFRLLWSFIKIM